MKLTSKEEAQELIREMKEIGLEIIASTQKKQERPQRDDDDVPAEISAVGDPACHALSYDQNMSSVPDINHRDESISTLSSFLPKSSKKSSRARKAQQAIDKLERERLTAYDEQSRYGKKDADTIDPKSTSTHPREDSAIEKHVQVRRSRRVSTAQKKMVWPNNQS